MACVHNIDLSLRICHGSIRGLEAEVIFQAGLPNYNGNRAFQKFSSNVSRSQAGGDDHKVVRSFPIAVEPSMGTSIPFVKVTSNPRACRRLNTAWSPGKVRGPGSAVANSISYLGLKLTWFPGEVMRFPATSFTPVTVRLSGVPIGITPVVRTTFVPSGCSTAKVTFSPPPSV